jgi:hypothetical protein
VTYKDEEDEFQLSVEAKNASSTSKVTRKAAGRQAIALVRSLVSLVNTLPTLPDADILVSMRLYYHEDRIPSGEDWVPKHFEDARDLAPETFAGGAPTKLLAGTTNTQFHQMAMSIALKKDYVDRAVAAAASSADTPQRADANASAPASHKTRLLAEDAAADLADPSSGASASASSSAAEAAEDDETRFERWVQAVRSFVVQRQSASIPLLRDHFGHEIPPVMIRRVLEELANRNVLLRPRGKRSGFTVLAVDLPAAAAEAAAVAADATAVAAEPATSSSAGSDADMPQRLWSLAVLFAWSVRGQFLTQASMAQALGLGRKERAITRSLVAKLAEKDLIASTPKGSLGREVFDCLALKQATARSSTWLRTNDHSGYATGLGLALLPDGDGTASSPTSSPSSSIASPPTSKRVRGEAPLTRSRREGDDDDDDSHDDDGDASAGARRVSGRLQSKRLKNSTGRATRRAAWV